MPKNNLNKKKTTGKRTEEKEKRKNKKNEKTVLFQKYFKIIPFIRKERKRTLEPSKGGMGIRLKMPKKTFIQTTMEEK